MCDIVSKLLMFMKPYVENIDSKKKSLDDKQFFLLSLADLKNSIFSEPKNIFNYEKQDLVISLLDNIDSNIQEYNAYKYILQAKFEEVYYLPQYTEAEKYINNFYDYINLYSIYIKKEYESLLSDYEKCQLINKYYLMFKNNEVFVNDIDEFKMMLDNFIFAIDEKIQILIYVIKECNKRYNIIPLKQETFYDVIKFQEFINKNKNLLNNKYSELLNIVSDYVDLTKNINEIVDYELINKININNIILAKQIWLMKKIELNYNNKKYDKVEILIKEFELNNEMFNKVRDIKDKKEAIRIIKGEC